MILKNQRGITLIELLLSISILSFVGVLIWSVFFQGTEYSNTAIAKNQMQQEANIIMTKITRIHQTSNSYEIQSPDECSLTIKDNDTGTTETIDNNEFCIRITKDRQNPINPNNTDVGLELTLYNKTDSNNSVKIETLLNRLKNVSDLE